MRWVGRSHLPIKKMAQPSMSTPVVNMTTPTPDPYPVFTGHRRLMHLYMGYRCPHGEPACLRRGEPLCSHASILVLMHFLMQRNSFHEASTLPGGSERL